MTEKRRTGHEQVVLRSGYNEEQEWGWHVYCSGCKYADWAPSYDAACDLRSAHRDRARPLDLSGGKPVKKSQPKKRKRRLVY